MATDDALHRGQHLKHSVLSTFSASLLLRFSATRRPRDSADTRNDRATDTTCCSTNSASTGCIFTRTRKKTGAPRSSAIVWASTEVGRLPRCLAAPMASTTPLLTIAGKSQPADRRPLDRVELRRTLKPQCGQGRATRGVRRVGCRFQRGRPATCQYQRQHDGLPFRPSHHGGSLATSPSGDKWSNGRRQISRQSPRLWLDRTRTRSPARWRLPEQRRRVLAMAGIEELFGDHAGIVYRTELFRYTTLVLRNATLVLYSSEPQQFETYKGTPQWLASPKSRSINDAGGRSSS